MPVKLKFSPYRQRVGWSKNGVEFEYIGFGVAEMEKNANVGKVKGQPLHENL